MIRKQVDFPDPEGPTIETNSPSSAVKEAASSARTGPLSPSYTFETSSTITCASSASGTVVGSAPSVVSLTDDHRHARTFPSTTLISRSEIRNRTPITSM